MEVLDKNKKQQPDDMQNVGTNIFSRTNIDYHSQNRWDYSYFASQIKLMKWAQTFIHLFSLVWLSFFASVPVAWLPSSLFKAGRYTHVPTTSASLYDYISVTYTTPLSSFPSRSVCQGLVDYDFILDTSTFYMALSLDTYSQTGFVSVLQAFTGSRIANLKVSYLTVDPLFTDSFSISQFAPAFMPPIPGPSSNSFHINFTDSTGVILDQTHENVLLPFLTVIDFQSPTQCFDIDIQFIVYNTSFYQVTASTTCDMQIYGFGFFRIIFDKTAIQNMGVNYFQYGTISAQNNDDSTLIFTTTPYIPSNFMIGVRSFSIDDVSNMKYVTTEGEDTQVDILSSSFISFQFTYWSFKMRDCPPEYPYFQPDSQLCYDLCPAGFYGDTVTNLCEPCYYTCMHCLNPTTCTDCDSAEYRYFSAGNCPPIDGYYDNGTFEAVPCTEGCATCSDGDSCDSCILNWIPDGLLCISNCDDPNCLECSSNISECTQCQTGFAFNDSDLCQMVCDDSNCIDCASNMSVCDECLTGFQVDANDACQMICDDTNCFDCLGNMSQCQQCDEGYELGSTGICQLICDDPGCDICSTTPVCEQCKDGYEINGTICQPLCSDINCISCPSTINICQQCIQGYAVSGSSCRIRCGDAYTKTPEEQCDDGNTNNNDGCSSSCRIENDFQCQPDSVVPQKSVCFYIGQVEIEEMYIQKLEGENKLKIVLDVQPEDLDIWEGIQDLIQIGGVDGITGYTVTRDQEGQIVIQVEYNEDVHGESLTVTIDPHNINSIQYPNHRFLRVTPSYTTFQIIPDDNEGAYYYEEDTYKLADTIGTLSTAVAIFGLAMFLLSLISGKMIGIEMMAVLQVSFLSLISLTQMNPCFSALSGLWPVNGYNSITNNDSLEDNLSPEQPKGINFFSRFLENYNLTMILVLVPMMIALIAFILSKVPSISSNKERLQKIRVVKEKAIGQFAFTGLMFGGYIIFVSLGLEIMFGIKNMKGFISLGSLLFAAIFGLLFIGYFVFLLLRPQFFGEFTNSFKKDNISSRHYNILMIQRSIVGILLVLLLNVKFQVCIPLALFVILAVYVGIRRPYKDRCNNIRVIANMLICVMVEGVYFWYRTSNEQTKHKSSISFYLPIIICTLLLVCIIGNSIILIIFLVKNCRSKLKPSSQLLETEQKNHFAKNRTQFLKSMSNSMKLNTLRSMQKASNQGQSSPHTLLKKQMIETFRNSTATKISFLKEQSYMGGKMDPNIRQVLNSMYQQI